MTEHERQTAFLRRLIRLDDTDERCRLEERIEKVQRDECCVRRAVWLVGLFGTLGLVVLAYGVVLLENFPYETSRFAVRLICEAGLGSLVALAGLAVVLMIYRMKMNRLHEECRRLIARTLESRLEIPRVEPVTRDRVEKRAPDASHSSTALIRLRVQP